LILFGFTWSLQAQERAEREEREARDRARERKYFLREDGESRAYVGYLDRECLRVEEQEKLHLHELQEEMDRTLRRKAKEALQRERKAMRAAAKEAVARESYDATMEARAEFFRTCVWRSFFFIHKREKNAPLGIEVDDTEEHGLTVVNVEKDSPFGEGLAVPLRVDDVIVRANNSFTTKAILKTLEQVNYALVIVKRPLPKTYDPGMDLMASSPFAIKVKGTGQLIRLGSVATAGRGAKALQKQNDWNCKSADVTRVHAIFSTTLVDGLYTLHVEDLGSREGTFVNGERIHGRAIVPCGATLRLGMEESAVVSRFPMLRFDSIDLHGETFELKLDNVELIRLLKRCTEWGQFTSIFREYAMLKEEPQVRIMSMEMANEEGSTVGIITPDVPIAECYRPSREGPLKKLPSRSKFKFVSVEEYESMFTNPFDEGAGPLLFTQLKFGYTLRWQERRYVPGPAVEDERPRPRQPAIL
jgi:hypothetical protein